MTNVRPLQMVIVYSTGADHGSLLAPLRVCVGAWVEGVRQTDREQTVGPSNVTASSQLKCLWPQIASLPRCRPDVFRSHRDELSRVGSPLKGFYASAVYF